MDCPRGWRRSKIQFVLSYLCAPRPGLIFPSQLLLSPISPPLWPMALTYFWKDEGGDGKLWHRRRGILR